VIDKSKFKALVEVSANFMLPTEFRANDDEEGSDEEIAMVQWVCQAESATFEKPKKHLHLKALYLKGFIDGKPLTEMLVDGGAAINLMPYSTFRKLGKRIEDLCPTGIRLTYFSGNISVTKGIVCVELIVGSTLRERFYPCQLLYSIHYASESNSMIYGVEVVLPTDIKFGSPRVECFYQSLADKTREVEINCIEERRLDSCIRTARYLDVLRRYYNRNVKGCSFVLGDLVLKWKPPQEGMHKLSTPWEGPFVVTEVTRPTSY